MINVTIDANNTIAKLDEIKGKTDKATADGIRKAQIHIQRMVDRNLASGLFGIKSRAGGLRASLALSPVMKYGTELVGVVGTNLKYSKIQEVGGTTHPTVTAKLRRFAWAKFYETGLEMWKWVALTKKSSLTVKIPEHFYMNQTMEQEKMNVWEIIRFAQNEALT